MRKNLTFSAFLPLAMVTATSCKVPESEFGNQLSSATEGQLRLDQMCATVPELDILKEFPTGRSQQQQICGRPEKNKVTEVFCGSTPPKITSLKELQSALGLGSNGSGNGGIGFGGGFLGGLFGGGFGGLFNQGGGFAFTGASSSLVGRSTSAINPRLVMFSQPNGNDPNMVALGFVRGEQFVELVARDSKTSQLNFYLVKFSQDCNQSRGGCNKGELLGPAIESNWREVTVYQDRDIENTILDCTQCHQPGGAGTAKILRMQELRNPWTHFLSSTTSGGRQLLADFTAAHPNKEFAGIPAGQIGRSDPAQLERFIRQNGFGNQPNEFPSAQIEGAGGFLPFFGSGAGGRDAWSPLYERSVKGQAIQPPYHKVKVTDPAELETMTKAYQDPASGKISTEQFPDTRNIHPNAEYRDLGIMVKEGLSGQEILVQACSQCRNSKLNQEISRARFNFDPTKMDADAKQSAIYRLNLDCDDPKKMPPVRFRTLNREEILRVEKFLSQ